MKVTISDWAWLPSKNYPADKIELLKNKLTIVPRKTSQHQVEIIPITLYRERLNEIGVPREYFMANRKMHHEIEYAMSEGREINLSFNGKLKEDQQMAVNVVMNNYRGLGTGGIIQASPGWGKTVVALGLLTAMKRTAVVIVGQSFLVDQWRKRIETFIPDARVGIIQQDKCQFGEKYDISIAMMQSLDKRRDVYPDELWNAFGLVITDECHRIGAKTWSSVVPLFNARYRLGASATPRRKDGTENVFFWHIGEILYKSKVRRLVPKVRRVFTGFEFYKNGDFDPNEHSKELQLKFMCANYDRNRLIVDELNKAVRAGRKVIVLSERRNHLEKLRTIFGQIKPEHCTVDFYVGGRSQQELDTAEKATVLFCTYQMAKEALDIPVLDTVFLTTPVMDVEQAVGRIMREHEGKKEPIVVDFIDGGVSRFAKLWNARLRFYKKEKMFIKEE